MADLKDFIDLRKISPNHNLKQVDEIDIMKIIKKEKEENTCKYNPEDNKWIKELKDNFKPEKKKGTGSTRILMNYSKGNEPDLESVDKFFYSQFNYDGIVLDQKWMRNRFLSPDTDLNIFNQGRYFSSSVFKYGDTSLGGHISCNPKHQFTRYADIKHPKKFARESSIVSVDDYVTNCGLGRYYSEAIDDNCQLVYMQFGVPEFNGILDFLFSSIDYKESVLANTGRKPTMYNIAKTIGSVIGVGVLFACFPYFTVAWLGASCLVKFLRDRTNFNYYYMQPTMYTYWATVNTILNQIATELRVVKPVLDINKGMDNDSDIVGVPVEQDNSPFIKEAMKNLLDDLYDEETGYLSAFNIAAKSQSMFIAYRKMREERMKENKSYIPIIDQHGRIIVDNEAGYFSNDLSDNKFFNKEQELSGSYKNFQDFLNRKVINGPAADPNFANDGFKKPKRKNVGGDPELASEESSERQAALQETVDQVADEFSSSGLNTSLPDGTYKARKNETKKSWWKKELETTRSALEDGGSYAVFQVEYTGSVSESFSNSTGEINTGGLIKSLAGKTRDLRFDLSGGNIGLGLNMDEFLGYAKDTVAGFLDGVTLGLSSVVTTILGDAYTTIPKKWNDSDMSLPQVSYTMKLRTPYGNTFSQLGSIYLPLSMLLAGVLPLSTGRSSYTSPFLCSLFCQGVQNIKMGMITNVSITRGTSKLGFNKSKRPMGIDVSFTVTDFSELMCAPINTSVFDTFKISYMDDSTFGRYLTTLCARDINTNKYMKNKISNILNRFWSKWSEIKDPSKYGFYIGDTLNGIASPFTAQGNFNLSSLPTKQRTR